MKKQCGNITLGDRYTELVHEITGVATQYTVHLTGINRVGLEYKLPNGEVRLLCCDETRLEQVDTEDNQ